MKKTPVEWLAVGLLFAPIPVFAGGAAQHSTAQPERDSKQDTAPPDPALLEFLGEWETRDGKWFDPTQLEDPNMTQPQQDRSTAKKQDERRD